MIFLRTPNDDVYEQARLALDAAWGLPNDRGTVTCIAPAVEAPRDSLGRIVLAVADEFSTWEPAATLLPQLIASGEVSQIDAADYYAAITSN
jgi:hypothetical protein